MARSSNPPLPPTMRPSLHPARLESLATALVAASLVSAAPIRSMPARPTSPPPGSAPKGFLTTQTNHLVESLQSAGLTVYVYLFMNEFVSQPYDFFSDATAQINAYVQKQGGGVDGLITDFPGTAHRYKLNTCLNMGNSTPIFMQPAQPGLIATIPPSAQPPAPAPMPLLTDSEVAEPPLPPVNNTTAPAPSHASIRMRTDVSILVMLLMLCASPLI